MAGNSFLNRLREESVSASKTADKTTAAPVNPVLDRLRDPEKYQQGLAIEDQRTEQRYIKQRYPDPVKSQPLNVAPRQTTDYRAQILAQKSTAAAQPITNESITSRLKQEADKHTQQLRGIELQQSQTAAIGGLALSNQLAEQKRQLLSSAPSAEAIKKSLLAEQAKVRVALNPADESSWLQFAANTLSPADLRKYQVDVGYKQAVKEKYLPQFQEENERDVSIKIAEAMVDEKFPNLKDGAVKDFLANMAGVLESWKGTAYTVGGLTGPSMAAAYTGDAGANAGAGLGAFLSKKLRGEDVKAGDVIGEHVDQGMQAAEELRGGKDELLAKGAEHFQMQDTYRTGTVGDDAVKGFVYDVVQVMPDMLVTIALAAATGGASAPAQMTAKQLAKSVMKKETRQAATKTILSKAILSPETIPLGTKIFAQSYQANIADGMPDEQAFFTALINAYGQSVLEGGGVNKAFREGGLQKAVDFLKSSIGEGFEEVKQNWWEGVVNNVVGGKSAPLISLDPQQESIVNPGRDLYSMGVGVAAGAGGAAVAAPGAAARYVKEKTQPQVDMPNLGDVLKQDAENTETFESSMSQYKQDMADYRKQKADYDSYQKSIKAMSEDTVSPTPEADYKDLTYSKGELKNAAVKLQNRLAEFEISRLSEEANNAQSMEEWAEIQNRIEATTPDSVVKDVLAGTAGPEVMEQVTGLAYGERMKTSTKAEAPNPMLQKLREVKFDEPVGPTMPELPKLDVAPKVDTSKMAPRVVERLHSDLAYAEEKGVIDKIRDMANDGNTRSEISKALNVPPRIVRSVMALNGIPDVKSHAFKYYKALQGYSTARGQETEAQQLYESPAPAEAVSLKEKLIAPAEAQTRVDSITELARTGAQAATDLSVGEIHTQRLGKRLGVDVVFFEGKTAPNGVYSSKANNTLFINREKAKTGEATMEIMGHEFLHFLQSKHNDLYKGMRDIVGDTLTAEKAGKLLERYKSDPQYQELLSGNKELLVEEMLADEAGSIFTDKAFWQSLAEKDETLAQKLVGLIRKFINQILTGGKTDSENLGIMTELQIKEFQKQFEDAVATIMKRDETGEIVPSAEADTQTRQTEMIIENGTAQPRYSRKTYAASDLQKIQDGLIKAGFNTTAVLKYLKDLDSIAAKISKSPELYDYVASEAFSPVKSNSDKLYVVSIDFSTLCKKRYILQATINKIQLKNGRALSPEDIMAVREGLVTAGIEVSCGMCYVDSARLKRSAAINELIDDWENQIVRKMSMNRLKLSDTAKAEIADIQKGRTHNQLSEAEQAKVAEIRQREWTELDETELAEIRSVDPRVLLSSDGEIKLAEEHPEIYKAAMTYISSRSRSKNIQGRAEYAPGMLQNSDKLTPSIIKMLNDNAGLRWQSWSDFEIPHLIDAMQVIGDMAEMQLKGHMYTKVPDAVRALGKTGLMINLSITPKGETGFNEKGELVFDPVEGMPFETALQLRTEHPDTTGTIAIGVNDKHILAMMADSRIDYIIPYHISGLSKKLRGVVNSGLAAWEDYTQVQNEKGDGKSPLLMDWWDYGKTGNENVLNYLAVCKERGLTPKFWGNGKLMNLLVDERGQAAFEAGRSVKLNQVRDGAWKLLIDRKMFNGDKPIVQAAVKPVFDETVMAKMMDEYGGGHNDHVAYQPVVDRFTNPKKGRLLDPQKWGFTNDAISDMLKEKHNISDKEAKLGAEAFKEIESIYSVQTATGRALGGPSNQSGTRKSVSRVKTLAKDFSEKFIDQGVHTFVGQTVTSYEDMALMAQVLRDPRFETLRVFFLNPAGEIVYHTGVSSRVPGVALAFGGDLKSPTARYDWHVTHFEAAKKLGATSFQLMHNHPSGNPSPSKQDLALTQIYTKGMGGLKFDGHVIINSKKYAVIDSNGTVALENLPGATEDKLLTPSKPHPLLGVELNRPDKFAAVGRALKTPDDYSTLLYLTPALKVRAIQEVPTDLILDTPKFKRHLAKHALALGSQNPVLLVRNPFLLDATKDLVKTNHLFEVVDYRISGSAARETVSPASENVWMGEELKGYSAWEEKAKYSTREKAPVFFSKLGQVVDAKMPNRASAKDVQNLIASAGVKADEIKWSGISDWLKDKDTVAKAEVQDFLTANDLDIEEIELGPPSGVGPKVANRIREQAIREGSMTDELEIALVRFAEYPENYENQHRLAYELGVDTVDIIEAVQNERATKFEAYTTPGGEKYRELLFKFNSSGKRLFQSAHWDEPNILAHARFNDRIDAEGNKVLFVQEVQSDWHQTGRKRGYEVPFKPITAPLDSWRIERELKVDLTGKRSGLWLVFDHNNVRISVADTKEDAIHDAMEFYNTGYYTDRTSVPDAPFSKTWHEFVLKRFLRFAAENGYDKLAWATGKQNADLYQLSTVVDDLSVYTHGEGLYWIHGKKDGRGVISEPDIPQDKLSDMLGKELATKIVNNENLDETYIPSGGYKTKQTFSGLDLDIGGKGMKGFYDQIIPEFLNKYVKKWGAKVENTLVGEDMRGSSAYRKGGLAELQRIVDLGGQKVLTKQMSVPITEAMKNSVLYEGQPRFSTRERVDAAVKAFGVTYDIREAGYLTIDGQLLDFSGKKQGGQPHVRHMDHREIVDIYDEDMDRGDAMADFVDLGNIRLYPEAGGFYLSVPPTEKQIPALRRFIERRNGEVYLDLVQDKNHDTAPEYAEYPEGTNPDRVLADIERFFRGEGVRRSAVADFHTRFSNRPEPTHEPSIDISMDEPKTPRDVKGWFANLYRRMVDRNAPVGKADERAGILASNAALVSGTVETVLTSRLVDVDGKDVGLSWKETCAEFMDNKDFWSYMAQLHNIDRARESRPVDPNMTPDDSRAYVQKVEEAHPEYKTYAKAVTGWIDSFMQKWAVDTGVIDRETYQDWREMYPHYFPTFREFSDLEDLGGTHGPGRKYADLASPVKRATGSGRDITNPVGNVMIMVDKVIRTARYNNVGKALVDSVRANPEAAQQYAEEIPANVGMFQHGKVDNVVTIWDEGMPVYLQINNKVLLESLMGLPKIINNARTVRKITGVYKGLITSYNPLFALRNIFRDIPTAYIYGSQNNPLFFLANLVKAGYQFAANTGGAAQYKGLGGAGAGQFSADEAAKYAKLLKPGSAIGAPIRFIGWINNLTEQAPRISEFNHVLKKTGDVQKALYAAQNVTVNFSRGGDIAKQIEPFVPYFNASLQGVDRFFKAFDFKKDPAGAFTRLVKAGIAITVPQLASYLLCNASDDEKERYRQLSQRTKDAYYVFPTGDGTYFKVPKSREVGVLFGTLFERALVGDYKGFAGSVATNFSPVDPFTNNLVAPLIYNLPMNKDFAEMAIVPQYMLNDKRDPSLQYDDNTSEIGRKLGQLTGLSPKKIDYIVRSYTGIIGQFLLPATTERYGAKGALDRVWNQAWTADPAFSSQSMTDFYDRLDELRRVATDNNLMNKVPSKIVTQDERMYNNMSKVSSAVSKATKYINANLDATDPKIREIRNTMNTYLRQAADAKTPAEVVSASSKLNVALYRLGVR